MNREPLRQISVTTSLEAEDAVTELVTQLFQQPAAVYTNERTKVTVVSTYCRNKGGWNPECRSALRAGLERIRASGLEIGRGTVSERHVPRQDWSESWKRHFKPIAIGSRLLIKPSWIKRPRRKGQAVVVLDPGLSFGTGNHPTTSFCLRELAARRKPGTNQSFWDIGTGSGILAIAAVKLGYSPVHAVDFDPESIRVARANAQKNRVTENIRFSRQDITRTPSRGRGKYQVICANLISDLLLRERERIAGSLCDDGALMLAGILKGEFSKVRRGYEDIGLKLARSRKEGEWQSGTFIRRAKLRLDRKSHS